MVIRFRGRVVCFLCLPVRYLDPGGSVGRGSDNKKQEQEQERERERVRVQELE
jgi:hypothetical protein